MIGGTSWAWTQRAVWAIHLQSGDQGDTVIDNPVHLDVERPQDAAAIGQLQARAFGPGRFARTAYRLREGGEADQDLCFVARSESQVIGSIQLTPIEVNEHQALLLGPLTVDPAFHRRGIGMALLKASLAAAAQKQYRFVILVGDEPYYARVGFRRAPAGRLILPGPVDPNRLLIKELTVGGFEGVGGIVKAVRARSATPR